MTTNDRSANCTNESSRNNEFVLQTGAILGAMLVVAGWLAFILVYAVYWSPGFDLLQNVIVSIASLGIAGLLIAGDVLIWYHPNGVLRRTRTQNVHASS